MSVPTDDEGFLTEAAQRLAALPGVRAVSLGGSRAQGTASEHSDWDLAIYYRGAFDPEDLRAVGWPGYVSEVGEWGGVFNGGAWLTIDGRRTDVHYRALDVIDSELDRAQAGRFGIQPLMFHLAGIPTYLVLAELALGRTLIGELPVPEFPAALRRSAPDRWSDRAARTFDYARDVHARAGRLTEFVALAGQAVAQSAHAALAARGQWATNDKQLLAAADLRGVDAMLSDLRIDPDHLMTVGQAVREACEQVVERARREDGLA